MADTKDLVERLRGWGGVAPWELDRDIREAADEIGRLRADLTVQWLYNHDEYCNGELADNDKCEFENDGCGWPKPIALGGDPDIHRNYDASLRAS